MEPCFPLGKSYAFGMVDLLLLLLVFKISTGGIHILPLGGRGARRDFDGEHGSHLTWGVKGESAHLKLFRARRKIMHTSFLSPTPPKKKKKIPAARRGTKASRSRDDALF